MGTRLERNGTVSLGNTSTTKSETHTRLVIKDPDTRIYYNLGQGKFFLRHSPEF